MVTNDPDALLIMNESAFRLDLLKKRRDFKIGIEILWIQLKDVTEQLECFVQVLWLLNLPSFDLSEQADGLIAVFIPGTRQHGVEMRLCNLEVAHLKEHFRQAEERLVILRIVLQGLLVALKGLVVVVLSVFYLAKDEVEVGAQMLDFLPERWQITALWSSLVLDYLQTCL